MNLAEGDDLIKFQKWLVGTLDGYKVMALGVKNDGVFEPNQVYMEAKKRPNL